MGAVGNGMACDVSGDHGTSAVRAAGALQDEFAPTLPWFYPIRELAVCFGSMKIILETFLFKRVGAI
jgi:hypothetical protein